MAPRRGSSLARVLEQIGVVGRAIQQNPGAGTMIETGEYLRLGTGSEAGKSFWGLLIPGLIASERNSGKTAGPKLYLK